MDDECSYLDSWNGLIALGTVFRKTGEKKCQSSSLIYFSVFCLFQEQNMWFWIILFWKQKACSRTRRGVFAGLSRCVCNCVCNCVFNCVFVTIFVTDLTDMRLTQAITAQKNESSFSKMFHIGTRAYKHVVVFKRIILNNIIIYLIVFLYTDIQVFY